MKLIRLFITLGCLLILTGCASLGPYTVDLAEPPQFFVENNINPLENIELENNIIPVFYATNRKKWSDGESKHRFYKNKQDVSLNIGKANVLFGDEGTSWGDLRDFITLEGKRPKHELKILDVEEYGPLNFARRRFDPKRHDPQYTQVDERLIKEINEQLAEKDRKNITIFVHGVSVPFDDPVLVAAELNYYNGFNSVAIGFSWPSQQKALRYLADVEQSKFAARYLSFLLLFLSSKTDVDQINIVAHSAGSRILSRALTDLSLLAGNDADREENIKKYKIGHVVFAGGDVSQDVMGVYIEYGLLDVVEKMMVYFSKNDKALGLSNWLWKEDRIGELDLESKKIQDFAIDFLKKQTKLELVDATGTPGSEKQLGHVYFLTSQWVSSDLMLFMRTNLEPDKRGLIQDDSGLYWKFPDNYKTRTTFKKLKNRIQSKRR